MKRYTLWKKRYITTIASVTAVFLMLSMGQSQAADLSPDIETKIEAYKEKLKMWSNDKDIIKAVEEMNARVVSMTNQSWKGLSNDDPEVMKFQTSAAGQKLTGWQQDKALGKLFLRDQNGNYIAGSKKPAIFNIADRKPFSQAMEGKTWNSKKAKKDPTTKLSSIQISTPVISNGKNIGVIHTSLIVE